MAHDQLGEDREPRLDDFRMPAAPPSPRLAKALSSGKAPAALNRLCARVSRQRLAIVARETALSKFHSPAFLSSSGPRRRSGSSISAHTSSTSNWRVRAQAAGLPVSNSSSTTPKANASVLSETCECARSIARWVGLAQIIHKWGACGQWG